MKYLLFLTAFFVMSSIAHASDQVQASEIVLSTFSSDLCTGYPEGTKKEPMLWAHCCIKHDLAYWVAGTRKVRKEVDKRLKSCVTEVAGKARGRLMYTGIRLGHLSPIKHPSHWGHAWPKKHRKTYAPLTEQQKAIALQQIYNAEIKREYIDQVVKELKL
ncbi:MAG: hypothetical protein HN509_09240 [Halobacteriovoraceae bacterium]|nr:hypothetical protein [Halobacteriovoraceae bacterium]MBT5092606.1 hypothetical protein [Halobacteriovoraceae bacterium]